MVWDWDKDKEVSLALLGAPPHGVPSRALLRSTIEIIYSGDMVVDSVIRNWVTMVVVKEAVPEGFILVLQVIAAFFYDDILPSPQPSRLQAVM